jgi:hypothetical protein
MVRCTSNDNRRHHGGRHSTEEVAGMIMRTVEEAIARDRIDRAMHAAELARLRRERRRRRPLRERTGRGPGRGRGRARS